MASSNTAVPLASLPVAMPGAAGMMLVPMPMVSVPEPYTSIYDLGVASGAASASAANDHNAHLHGLLAAPKRRRKDTVPADVTAATASAAASAAAVMAAASAGIEHGVDLGLSTPTAVRAHAPWLSLRPHGRARTRAAPLCVLTVACPFAPFSWRPRPAQVYRCEAPDCGRAYTSASHLKRHQRSHTSEKPHICTKCGREFFIAHPLQYHERMHSGDKPYQCTHHGCGKAYSQPGDYYRHMRKHTGQTPYVCLIDDCPKTFIRGRDIENHRRKAHGL